MRLAMPVTSNLHGAGQSPSEAPTSHPAWRGPWVPGRMAARRAPAGQSDRVALRAESSARTGRCRRPDRTCAATESTGTGRPDRMTGSSRETQAGWRAPAARSQFEELDGGVPRAGRKGIGEPGAVGRPGKVFGAPALAAIDWLQCALVEIADEHFVSMVRNRQKTTAGSSLQRDHPANVPAEFARHTRRRRPGPALRPRRH